MLNLEIIPQWVIPLIRVKNPDHAQIKDGLVRHSYEREKRSATPIASGVAPKFKSNLYESTFDLFKADVPEVKALAQFCTQAVGSVVTELRRRLNRPEPASLRIEMAESWVHITRDGGYHDQHLHPNCSWCGIYYIDPGDSTLTPAKVALPPSAIAPGSFARPRPLTSSATRPPSRVSFGATSGATAARSTLPCSANATSGSLNRVIDSRARTG